jgi:Clp amino terminal domain, pathogenicity island component/KAP family P-loop domain
MFERFTDRARRVIVLAQEEARMLNHNYIGTEHILLGLIHEGEGVGAEAMESLGISLEAVRQQVEEIIGQGQQVPSGYVPLTPRAKKVLELSLHEALQLGHNYIDTGHILLGLIHEGEGVAGSVLVKSGADLNRARASVLQVLEKHERQSSGPTGFHTDLSSDGSAAEDVATNPIAFEEAEQERHLTADPIAPDGATEEEQTAGSGSVSHLIEVERSSPSFLVASVTGEATAGRDYLGIDQDARAIAGLIASRGLEPPLALAVYGSWGSGKTFFMRRIQRHVELLSHLPTSSDARVFQHDILHVWFSAWHYSSGNLWASLLHHIFASLNRTKSHREVTLDNLMCRVEGARQLKAQADARVAEAEYVLKEAEQRISEAREASVQAMVGITQLRATDLWSAITMTAEEESLRSDVVRAAQEAGLGHVGQSVREVAVAAGEVIDTYSRLRVLATAGTWYRTPLAFAIYAAVLVSGAGTLAGVLLSSANPLTGHAVLVIAQLAAIASATAAWISRQASAIRRFSRPAQRLRARLVERHAEEQRKLEQQLMALTEQKQLADAELSRALAHQTMVAAELTAAERGRSELTGAELMRRYLAERAGSGDYERYLGVIGMAHRDLSDLSGYLSAALAEDHADGSGVNRIVLYIDDLDRCQPEVVTAVLDAVHLLLALPIFVVVVGLDPRWARQSLVIKHAVLLTGNADLRTPSPADYLEKIFQLSYVLPELDQSGAQRLVRGHAAGFLRRTDPAGKGEDVEPDLSAELGLEPKGSDMAAGEPGWMVELGQEAAPDSATMDEISEAVSFDLSTLQELDGVACLVSASPRRAKRFLNVYLLVRARLLTEGTRVDDVDVAMVLVALFVGVPLTMELVADRLSGEKSLRTVLLDVAESVSVEWERVSTFVASQHKALDLPCERLEPLLHVVRRFNGAIPACDARVGSSKPAAQ